MQLLNIQNVATMTNNFQLYLNLSSVGYIIFIYEDSHSYHISQKYQ